ncbi:MAG: hypothetical protein M1829_005839 [Trizodia sp. TS-e1964]|nr:MAG: hypothetical protein M1829_005839 [Trizodia sp. TS-e1964]
MGDFKISASLEGHEDDVRAVLFPNAQLVLSASRDTTVRSWKLISSDPALFDGTISSHGSAFVNSLTYLAPSSVYPKGLVISGGKDTIVEVRQSGQLPDENAEALLLGHSNNICALDVDPDGTYIVSGSWDNQARIWNIGKWEQSILLDGHDASVWAVLAYNRKIAITGSADSAIRVFETNGRLVRKFEASQDVIRALCKLSPDHASGAQFASAGNDGVIRLWNISGQRKAKLEGHLNFIYSLACLPTGEIVSSGEDRTVRIWSGKSCIQTITHPALSVWGVSVCAENGDIVSGASDNIVRVFSREKGRQASAELALKFEEAIKAFSIPQEDGAGLDPENIHKPEFLQQKSGTVDGQVVMIKEANGGVTAHQWSSSTQKWLAVGTVVDSAKGRSKANYLGQDYDYVFDVDISDGAPPLKLPYNQSENPHEAAKKFIESNELPISYLEQVANFIVSNTPTAKQPKQSQQPRGADPWGTEARYIPGDPGTGGNGAPPPPAQLAKVIPQTEFLSITQANFPALQRKIEEVNQNFITSGNKDLSLNPSEVIILQRLNAQLQQKPATASHSSTSMSHGLPVAIKLISTWPVEHRVPGLDLLRLIALTPMLATFESNGNKIIDILAGSGIFEGKTIPNNVMLAIRAFANLFHSIEGQALVSKDFDKVYSLVEPYTVRISANRNLTIALTTLLINYSVLLTSTDFKGLPLSADRAITLLKGLASMMSLLSQEAEATYRALVAMGTLLTLGEEVKIAGLEVFDIGDLLIKVKASNPEPRIANLVKEIESILEK